MRKLIVSGLSAFVAAFALFAGVGAAHAVPAPVVEHSNGQQAQLVDRSTGLAPLAHGTTPTGGFVAIPADTVGILECSSPKGVGDSWCYGTSYAPDGTKTCYSNYTQTAYHSATAKIGSSTVKSYAQRGRTASATAYGGVLATCYAYWDIP